MCVFSIVKVLNRTMDRSSFEAGQPTLINGTFSQVPLLHQHSLIPTGSRKDCIRLRGLPYEAQVEQILEFLGDSAKNIVYQGVHMVYNAQVCVRIVMQTLYCALFIYFESINIIDMPAN